MIINFFTPDLNSQFFPEFAYLCGISLLTNFTLTLNSRSHLPSTILSVK